MCCIVIPMIISIFIFLIIANYYLNKYFSNGSRLALYVGGIGLAMAMVLTAMVSYKLLA